ncbi:hypothetical protein EBT16_00805 [bacterium]|nr:hypothetical protein [bacterium]
MKRFYFGNEEGDEEDEDELDDTRFMMPDASEFISMARLDNPDQYLLECSLRMCEKSLFWRLFSVERKTSMLSKVFIELKKLTEGFDDAQV